MHVLRQIWSKSQLSIGGLKSCTYEYNSKGLAVCQYSVTLSNRGNCTHIQYSVIFALSNKCKDVDIQYSVIFAVSNRCNNAQIQYSVIFALFNRCKDAQIQYSVIFALSNRFNDAWPYSVFTWSVNNTRRCGGCHCF